MLIAENYCQRVDGEPLFVFYVCGEVFDSKAEITQHINEKHESPMNNDTS